jgi:hypothetical protein
MNINSKEYMKKENEIELANHFLVTRRGTVSYSFLKTYNAHPIVSLPPWR